MCEIKLSFFINFFLFLHRSVEKVQKELTKSRDEHRKNLTEAHPVLSRLAPWLRSKLQAAEYTKVSKSVWTAHEEAIKMCLKHNLQQTVYFLNRDLAFMRDVRSIISKFSCIVNYSLIL
jgi:hypothetical protein